MKMKKSNWLCFAVILLSVLLRVEAAEPVIGDYPSKDFHDAAKIKDGRFVLHEMRDLRLLFCSREALKDRMTRSIAVVDDVRAALALEEHKAAREVEIGNGITVGDLLKKIGFERRKGVPWKGGQPQLRLIKRDAIIQSPLGSDTSSGNLDVEAFLKQPVAPGDFLIIATIS